MASDSDDEMWDEMFRDDGMVGIERDESVWSAQEIEEQQGKLKNIYNDAYTNVWNPVVLHSVTDTKAWVHYYLEKYRQEEYTAARKNARWLAKDYDETAGEM
jgi:hypothetical protein